MPFLSLAGVTVPVAIGGAQETTPDRVGSESRAYAGNLRSTVRTEKRSWTVKTRSLSSTEESNIRTAIANGVFVAMSGDYVSNVPITVSALRESVDAVKVTGGFRNTLTLTIKEA